MPEHDYAWGPEVRGNGQVRFRLWAPDHPELTLDLDGRRIAMERDPTGWFTTVTEAAPGTPYCFVLPDGTTVSDPAAWCQAGDVHGPSAVPDPAAYGWRTQWSGRPWEETVFLELHVGTFTEEGTYRAAIDRLDHLAETGFTAVELMPVAQFGGDRGWGYDAVLPYAPHPAYGTPEDLKAFVDAAHERGLMVFLDVIYNHFGPDGNYLHAYASSFFHSERDTPWGGAIDYSESHVRQFFVQNAVYWLDQFRFDGLRLDAVDHIHDESEPDLLTEIATTVRAAFPDRHIHLTTEDNRNLTRYHERGPDGAVPLFSGEWNDDFHNAAHELATGESQGYYLDFAHDPAGHVARALAEGFAYQGEMQPSGEPRGVASGHLPPTAFVDFLQNHDQIGNRAFGERLEALTDLHELEALSAILLLSPHIPLMFMGEEWNEVRPFAFFVGFDGELGQAVRDGRRREFEKFPEFSGHNTDHIPDPMAMSTFEASRIDWSRPETPDGAAALARTRHLLDLRRSRIVPHLAGARRGGAITWRDGPAFSVEWPLGTACLGVIANLSTEEKAMPAPRGEVIHRTGHHSGGVYSTIHWIEERPRIEGSA